MNDQPKLLPCPWCGHTNGLVKNPRGDVDCIRCCVGVPHEYWNKRAPDSEREAMARVCIAASDFVAVQGRYGFEQQAFTLLDKALTDLERARKGTA